MKTKKDVFYCLLLLKSAQKIFVGCCCVFVRCYGYGKSLVRKYGCRAYIFMLRLQGDDVPFCFCYTYVCQDFYGICLSEKLECSFFGSPCPNAAGCFVGVVEGERNFHLFFRSEKAATQAICSLGDAFDVHPHGMFCNCYGYSVFRMRQTDI